MFLPVALSLPNPCIAPNLTCSRLAHALHVALLVLDLAQRVRDYLGGLANGHKMQKLIRGDNCGRKAYINSHVEKISGGLLIHLGLKMHIFPPDLIIFHCPTCSENFFLSLKISSTVIWPIIALWWPSKVALSRGRRLDLGWGPRSQGSCQQQHKQKKRNQPATKQLKNKKNLAMSWISPTFLSANCSQADLSISSLLLVIFTLGNKIWDFL